MVFPPDRDGDRLQLVWAALILGTEMRTLN